MAKGDHARQQNQLNTQGNRADTTLQQIRPILDRQNLGLEQRFGNAADQGQADYGNLMNTGQGLLGTILNGPVHNFGAYSGYQNFANTGGFSPEDIQNMRARSVAPMRAVYANAQSDLNRQRALTGGYSPNYGAATAKMARELGYGLSDASTNTEASLADAIHQGKLAGLSGMTGIDTSLLNNQTQRLGLANSTLGQMNNLYGTAPGMAQMYGNQMLNSTDQQLKASGLQNDIMRNYLTGQNNVANTQGNTQAVLGNIKSGVDLASDLGKMGSQF
jgi:hypothetical protein